MEMRRVTVQRSPTPPSRSRICTLTCEGPPKVLVRIEIEYPGHPLLLMELVVSALIILPKAGGTESQTSLK